MSLVVEDGTGLAGAESYVSVADCATYATARALTFDSGSGSVGEAALRRATAWIDATYRYRFPGYRTNRRLQALEWPRTGAYYYVRYEPGLDTVSSRYGFSYDAGNDWILSNVVPIEIKNATCEAAVRELAAPGCLTVDLDNNGAIRRQRAGDTEIEYGGNTSLDAFFPTITNALSGLLRSNHQFSGRAVRG